MPQVCMGSGATVNGTSASNFEIYDDNEYTVEEAVKAMVASPGYKAAFHRLQLRSHEAFFIVVMKVSTDE